MAYKSICFQVMKYEDFKELGSEAAVKVHINKKKNLVNNAGLTMQS